MSLKFQRLLSLFFAALMLMHLLVVAATPARAQFFDDTQDEEDAFIQDEDTYFEDQGTGAAPGEAPSRTGEQDLTEGSRYVDESLVPSARGVPTLGGRRQQLTLVAVGATAQRKTSSCLR